MTTTTTTTTTTRNRFRLLHMTRLCCVSRLDKIFIVHVSNFVATRAYAVRRSGAGLFEE
jgi:hypothetical protein